MAMRIYGGVQYMDEGIRYVVVLGIWGWGVFGAVLQGYMRICGYVELYSSKWLQ